jgi:hypothetical protein
MSSKASTFTERVAGSVSQGLVAAVVGAGLGAVAEPIVNTVLVERISVQESLRAFDWGKAWHFFYGATLPTNLIKFPL